jgi:hypothetical protein
MPVIELGSGVVGGGGAVSWAGATVPILFSLAALAIYALLSNRTENDDDDSNPGGGLMQPVA